LAKLDQQHICRKTAKERQLANGRGGKVRGRGEKVKKCEEKNPAVPNELIFL
jgi:hypothetical protein